MFGCRQSRVHTFQLNSSSHARKPYRIACRVNTRRSGPTFHPDFCFVIGVAQRAWCWVRLHLGQHRISRCLFVAGCQLRLPGRPGTPATEVLPKLKALGNSGRTVWFVYAALPLLLIPAGIGAARGLRRGYRETARAKQALRTTDSATANPERALRTADLATANAAQVGAWLQAIAAVCMTIGLARWSTVQWALANAWQGADAAVRATIASRFDWLNLVLGNGIGEFAGELALYGSFMAFGVALRQRGAVWLSRFAIVTAIGGWIGMFRYITPVVQSAADVTNVLLPLFLIAFGVALVRVKVQ